MNLTNSNPKLIDNCPKGSYLGLVSILICVSFVLNRVGFRYILHVLTHLEEWKLWKSFCAESVAGRLEGANFVLQQRWE